MSSLVGREVAEDQASVQRTFHGMTSIMWSVSAYTTLIMMGTSGVPQDVMHSAILGTCFYFLGNAFGEQYGAFLAIVSATIMTLVWTYAGGNMIAFGGCLFVTVVGGCAFCIVAVVQISEFGRAGPGSDSCKLFSVTTLILKSMLKHGIVSVTSGSMSSIVLEFPEAFFSMSFLLLIMALWLAGAGVEIVNPFRPVFNRSAQDKRYTVVTSILYWTGAVIVVAYVGTILAISTLDTPVIAKVACAVFAICTVAVAFKVPGQSSG